MPAVMTELAAVGAAGRTIGCIAAVDGARRPSLCRPTRTGLRTWSRPPFAMSLGLVPGDDPKLELCGATARSTAAWRHRRRRFAAMRP